MRYIAWLHSSPESSDPKLKAKTVRNRTRAVDIAEVLGELPMPGAAEHHPLVRFLFEMGGILGDGYLTWEELESWQRVTGTELDPWEASLILEMSKAFLRQQHESKSIASICPWPKGENIWRHVLGEKYKKQLEAEKKLAKLRKQKEQASDGTRKRHRNPPPG